MEKLMKFENSDIQMIQIDGKWYFELYSVGMALGQVKVAKGKNYPRKDRIDENAESAEIKPVVRNGQPFITEEQVYDLMLETRTDKCRVFRKWLTNEVLPELNHTGTYTMKDEPNPNDKTYEYFDKTYNGLSVLTSADVEYITKIKHATIDWYLRTKCVKGKDYYYITGDELKNFKRENPRVSKLSSVMYLITREGFMKICRAYGIKIEEPKCFESKDKHEIVVDTSSSNLFVSKGTHKLLEDIRKEAEGLKQLTYLLDIPDGFMLATDTQQMYKKAIQGKAKRLSSMTSDIHFTISACVNK